MGMQPQSPRELPTVVYVATNMSQKACTFSKEVKMGSLGRCQWCNLGTISWQKEGVYDACQGWSICAPFKNCPLGWKLRSLHQSPFIWNYSGKTIKSPIHKKKECAPRNLQKSNYYKIVSPLCEITPVLSLPEREIAGELA